MHVNVKYVAQARVGSYTYFGMVIKYVSCLVRMLAVGCSIYIKKNAYSWLNKSNSLIIFM